jgi:hypothetical protein
MDLLNQVVTEGGTIQVKVIAISQGPLLSSAPALVSNVWGARGETGRNVVRRPIWWHRFSYRF